MKITRLLPLVLLFIAIGGCDKIDNPIIVLNNQYLEGVYGPPPLFTTLDQPRKNVFMEEFTGHLCGFCPPATAIMKQLDAQLGPRLVAVAVHAGTLASISAPPYTANYNTPAGDIFWGQLENGFNPCARIDRTGGLSNFYIDNQWVAKVNEQLSRPPSVALQMVTDYVEADKNLNIHVHAQFLQALTGNYQIIVLLLESKIISAQSDYSLNPSTIYEYEHNYVLRTNVTNALGEPLRNNPRVNDQLIKSYTLPMKDVWVPENCIAVAVVVDSASGEVINAVESYIEL